MALLSTVNKKLTGNCITRFFKYLISTKTREESMMTLIVCILLVIVIVSLIIKIALIHKSMGEIAI